MSDQSGAARVLDVMPEGRGWAVKKPGQAKPESRHLFLEAAERAARHQLSHQGGGEMRFLGPDGRIRDTEKVASIAHS